MEPRLERRAAVTEHVSAWALAAVAACATTAGAVVTKALDAIHDRRVRAGMIRTSDADEVWNANHRFVQHMQAELQRLDGRIDALSKENNDLRETNARLVYANEGFVEKLDALRRDNQALITKNEELAVANGKLEERVEALLARLNEPPLMAAS